ncbi:sensor domain-containing diguanylate cyclase [bacterium]|nr:sensor domain-containing diguanylate cyclase [bacterium]
MTGEKRLLQALLATTRLIAANHPLQEVVHRLADELKGLLHADRCSVLIVDDEKHELAFHDSSALSPWERENIRFRMGEGVAGWVAQNREPVLIEDVKLDPRFKRHPGQLRKMVSMICVPLEMHGRLIGVLTLTTSQPEHVFVQDELELVVLIAAHISLALQSHRLYELSVLDGLTNVYNRRYLDQRLRQELADSRRHKKPLTVALLDLDHFKKLNDGYGHQAGDQVLCDLSGIISKTLREHDVLARYGGEEFAMILSGTSSADGLILGERLRGLIANTDFLYKEQKLPVTISLGLATFPDDADDVMGLLRAADKALYRAKAAGRNHVVAAGR